MALNAGIIGLPNVGKSTLFNALTMTMKAQASNYPFTTIEPNKGIVDVSDERLTIISNITKSATIVANKLEFVDIAGLVKGAHKGEGLGNQFLANIKEVSAIIHVLRCFEDSNIIHVNNEVNPVSDAETVNTELMIADLESLEKRIFGLEKKAKVGDKLAKEQLDVIAKILPYLREGKPVRDIDFTEEEEKAVKLLFLMTAKPVLYVCNVSEDEVVNYSNNKHVQAVQKLATQEKANIVIISAKIEQEISAIESETERFEYLQMVGLSDTGLNKIISSAFGLLKLQTYFTSGPKETRAWTIKKGAKAPSAAGEIHSDFEKGFISAEVISYNDFVSLGGESKARENGKLKIEGKNYIVQDGDIILFRFNV